MRNMEVVYEDVVQDETLLADIGSRSTALAGKCMVMWEEGHWCAIAPKVSIVAELRIVANNVVIFSP